MSARSWGTCSPCSALTPTWPTRCTTPMTRPSSRSSPSSPTASTARRPGPSSGSRPSAFSASTGRRSCGNGSTPTPPRSSPFSKGSRPLPVGPNHGSSRRGMDLGLSERTAAVAASSKGLGLAVATALAAEGVRVAICGRDADRIKAAAEGIGDLAIPLVADVSTTAGATSFVEEAIDALGRVDILVTNAGGPPPGTFGSTPLQSYGDAIGLNLLSVIAMCPAAAPGMTERQRGRIIGITSMGVRQPIPSVIASNVARAGATAFLKTLAGEVAKNGVTVNTVQPGSHATDRLRGMYGNDLSALAETIPVARTGEPADFGSVVASLASERAGFITGGAIPG